MTSNGKKGIAAGITVAIGLGAFVSRHSWVGPVEEKLALKPIVTKSDIARALSEALPRQVTLPEDLVLDLKGKRLPVKAHYAFDAGLQSEMQGLFNSYRPDYGAFVAIDATTGRILSIISWNPNNSWTKDHLALRATFPTASVFKVVTAAAAISEKKVHADTMMSFSGRPHTLYKNSIFKEKMNRWTTHLSLKQAFAKSINTVFGKLGVFIVGPTELRAYADRFGFNRTINADLPIQQGKALITEDPWEIAEAASGYTRNNTMSPLQGALIAATIANDGKMMEPYVVDSLTDANAESVYKVIPTLAGTVIDPATATEMREMMRETVAAGTSRHSFKGFAKGNFGFVDVGGKTGSLTGADPAGKYDWFVGYGVADGNRIAVAALTISKEYWKVKSAYLARHAIETYFKEKYSATFDAAKLAKIARNSNRRLARNFRYRRHPANKSL